MLTRYAMGVVTLVFCSILLTYPRNGIEANIEPTGAILSGECSGGGIRQGVPQVVFLLGEDGNAQCNNESGSPTRGIPMPSAGTLRNLRVSDDAANIGSVVIIYVNGRASVLTCTENSTGKCSNTSNRVIVRAGDEVAATYTSSTGNLSNAGMWMSLEKLGR